MSKKNANRTEQSMTLAELRAKLETQKGKRYWRSVDELADTPEFQAAVAQEFPEQASEWIDSASRRSFLKLMGASLAMAGMAGCTKQPEEPIYPYVKQPEDLVLGRPMYFATAHPFTTGAIPLLVKSDAFRPIKVDGNPEHPAVKGSSDPYTQGTLLDLYDPDRAQHVTHRGEVSEFAEFQSAFRTRLAQAQADGGKGIYFLSTGVTSPTLARQWNEATKIYPNIQGFAYDAVNRDVARTALPENDVQYVLGDADVILSLDADFLSGAGFPGFHQLAREYAERRKLDGKPMNRLYSVETATTTTGLKADHRLVLRASELPAFAAELAALLGVDAPKAPAYNWSAEQKRFLAAVAKDLKAKAGKSVVIPGEQSNPATYALALKINEALGNVGKTIFYTDTVNAFPLVQGEQLKQLVSDIHAGKVDWLIILGGNPIYTVPADLEFAAALAKVPTIAYLTTHQDETAEISHWTINAAHYLESWSDARAYDGSVTIVQPLIDPLYGGKTAHDIVQLMLNDPGTSAYQAVRTTWLSVVKDEAGWRKALHQGWIGGTAFEKKTEAKIVLPTFIPAPSKKDALEVVFRPDANIYDGRWSNVGWLQELPKPVTNLSWDNAVLVSFDTLGKLGIAEQDILEIQYGGKKVTAPVLMMPGLADNTLLVHLGYGRTKAGRLGSGAGFNAYLIRPSAGQNFISGAAAKKVDGIWAFAVTKSHYLDQRSKLFGGDGSGTHSLEGNEAEDRGIIRSATLEEFERNPNFAHEGEMRDTPDKDTTLFPNWDYEKSNYGQLQNAWGMAIDMNSCIGCNACIVGCYAENNIAVVGKQQVRIGRNMQWLRIDTYFEGDLHAPKAHFQPMACQHCENAPCEQVCPVGATVHTPEGLNAMVYNRCVGTRYCSNNCPYKVRRFNFLLYSDYETESLKLQRNPDVSVRSRGVMEKCSYCVQRISAAKIEADKENRPIRDGEIVTACQQACPTSAITFGNLNDKTSKVTRLKQQKRNYQVLADVNTRPRTTYVAGVVNPNPELNEAPVEHAPGKGA
jgi:molybdopterin-containing oxidoreductase family iron-sulfur binding subunit